jgi:hypothetical protein
MTEYGFTLIVEGKLDLDVVDALFEAGCSDMTFQGDEAGPATADVHREAANLVDAVLSAIRDIERVPGLRVIEVERQDLVGLADIAWRLDRSAESVRLLATGRRGPGGFPAPAIRRRRGQLWRWAEVAAWANRHLGRSFDLQEAVLVTMLNAALALRRGGPGLSESERRALQELATAS